MRRLLGHAPIERGGCKCGGCIGMRDGSQCRCLRETSPPLEFLAAKLGDRGPEFTGKVRKDVEGAPFCPLLTHEQQWNVRAAQEKGGENVSCARVQRWQPLAKWPVADLIVVLQKLDE